MTKEVPDTYQPKHLRPQPNAKLKPREVTYALGEEHYPDSFGMWDGPTPSLQYVLNTEGQSSNSRLIRFNADGTDEVLYHWDNSKQLWFRPNKTRLTVVKGKPK